MSKYKVKIFNKIANEGLKYLEDDLFEYGDDIKDPDALLLRSHKLQENEIPDSVKAIARAGAGINNIPVEYCKSKGIAVFNTPGANANAVKELVLAGLLLSSRDILGGLEFVKGLDSVDNSVVEKNKSKFKGSEIQGKNIAIIGLGAIGISVANAALSLGMNVHGYDPFISVKNAWGLSRNVVLEENITSVLQNADYVTLHLPLNEETRKFIDKEKLELIKKTAVVLNFSRAEIVDQEELLYSLKNNKIGKYVTDFPSKLFQGIKNVIAMPHLGASTTEAEINCAVMAAKQVKDFLLRGDLTNTVNLPNGVHQLSTNYRVAIIHENIPKMVQKITSVFGDSKINIVEMINKSRVDVAYTLVDIDANSEDICQTLKNESGIYKVRLIAQSNK